MPTYVCVVKAGLLNNLQKHRIAAAITRLHSETTGAPTGGVVFTEDVVKIAGQQGRYAVGHGLSPSGVLWGGFSGGQGGT